MRNTLNTYKGYTIGCALVWAVILLVVGTQASDGTRRTIFLVFGGWVIGWTSATIARSVYPPPKIKLTKYCVGTVLNVVRAATPGRLCG
jgi:hypothetical protein